MPLLEDTRPKTREVDLGPCTWPKKKERRGTERLTWRWEDPWGRVMHNLCVSLCEESKQVMRMLLRFMDSNGGLSFRLWCPPRCWHCDAGQVASNVMPTKLLTISCYGLSNPACCDGCCFYVQSVWLGVSTYDACQCPVFAPVVGELRAPHPSKCPRAQTAQC